MTEVLNKKRIRAVFRDVQKHLAIAQFIRRFSTNKEDIRKKALINIDLSASRNVLELGCAFGSFTEALQGRLHPDAQITGMDMIPEYKPLFLDACRRAGYVGHFYSSGIQRIKKIRDNTFDLVICSYALYFFPEIIPDISRILRNKGYFITITHSRKDMHEMVSIIKKITKQSIKSPALPLEIIFEQFSAENGALLLKPFFGQITEIEFNNSLVFQSDDLDHFWNYFLFKNHFSSLEKISTINF